MGDSHRPLLWRGLATWHVNTSALNPTPAADPTMASAVRRGESQSKYLTVTAKGHHCDPAVWVGWGLYPSRVQPSHLRARNQLPNQAPHWLGRVQGKRLLDHTLASSLLQPEAQHRKGTQGSGVGTASSMDLVLLVGNKGQLGGSVWSDRRGFQGLLDRLLGPSQASASALRCLMASLSVFWG